MKKAIILVHLLLAIVVKSQVFQVDTLQFKGISSKYINIVILGDGYTAAQQPLFISDAGNLSSSLLSESPWSEYKNYFNVFAIRVISQQSGATHPNNASDCNTANVPVSSVNTHLGCAFDSYGIHRLVVPAKTSTLVSVLSTNFPNYDQVLVVANSPYYGGSGGSFATSTADVNSAEISMHEIGHSFAGLADEYYAGDSYASERPNMTQQTNPNLVKWKNWMSTNSIGIYQHCCGGNSATWYRPHNNCKMRYLGVPFCSVCKQAIIEKIHSLVNPIVDYSPANSGVVSVAQPVKFRLLPLMKPIPNTLSIKWKLNGTTIFSNVDSIQMNPAAFQNGFHTLSATVIDTSNLLRVDNHFTVHVSAVTWTVNKIPTGISAVGKPLQFDYSVFPNPSKDLVTVHFKAKESSPIKFQIINMEGRVVRTIREETDLQGVFEKTLNISNLANGNYILVMESGGVTESLNFIKEQ